MYVFAANVRIRRTCAPGTPLLPNERNASPRDPILIGRSSFGTPQDKIAPLGQLLPIASKVAPDQQNGGSEFRRIRLLRRE